MHEHLPPDEIVARLRETPLFAGVEDAPLRELVARGEIVDLPVVRRLSERLFRTST